MLKTSLLISQSQILYVSKYQTRGESATNQPEYQQGKKNHLLHFVFLSLKAAQHIKIKKEDGNISLTLYSLALN